MTQADISLRVTHDAACLHVGWPMFVGTYFGAYWVRTCRVSVPHRRCANTARWQDYFTVPAQIRPMASRLGMLELADEWFA